MSYILDALRRADSERERERSAVPGLHTQAVPAGASDGDGEARSNPWKWPIVAAFGALLALVAWMWFGRPDVQEPLPVAAAPVPAPVPTAPPPAPPAAPPPVVAPAPPPAAASVAPPPPAPAPAPKPVARKRAPPPPAKAPEPEPKIPTLSELPEEVRREVPAITIGGSVYSKGAANRMLMINGQVFHEGDALATGLVLEQIRQKSAVLRFRTHRYQIAF